MSSPRRRGQVSVVHIIIIILTLFLAGLGEAKFLSADLRWPGRREQPLGGPSSLTDLLTFKDPDEDPVLRKAMQVINNLATRSTCHQAGAAQLLLTCKAVSRDDWPAEGKHELLERAKSVYAVRLAVCETREGRAPIPTSCKPVLAVPQQMSGEFEVINSKYLPPCLEALMAEHYYWTSYSNSKQDANTLCQAVTLEATKLEALHSYQQLAELLPEFRNDLLSARKGWFDFFKKQQHDAESLGKLHRQNHDEIKQRHKVEMNALQSAMKVAKDGLVEASSAMQRTLASTDSEIGNTHEALAQLLTGFTSLQQMLNEASKAFGKSYAENAATQEKEMSKLHDLALVTTQALEGLRTNELTVDLGGLFRNIRSEIDDIMGAQSSQLLNIQDHLRLSEELTEATKANLVREGQLRDKSAHLASELENANAMAGYMTQKLNKVDSALTRMERASSVLSTLFAILAGPAQLADRLHLRLLGIFTMPTVMLFFWKPRQYAYTLIATYVFIECSLSLVTDYHQSICAFGASLIRKTSTIPWLWTWKSLALVLSLVALYAAIATHGRWPPQTRRRKAASLRSKAGYAEKHLGNDSRYYLEHRLRSGKKWQPSSDRFRRSSTVC